MRNYRLKLSSLVVASIFLWTFFNLLGNYTHFNTVYAVRIAKHFFGPFMVRIVCAVVLLMGRSRINLKKALVIIFLGELSAYFSKSTSFIVLMYLLAVGSYVDEERVISAILVSSALVLTITMISALAKIIPNPVTVSSDGHIRDALGFTHPNTMATILFQIAICSWLICKNKSIPIVISFATFLIAYAVNYSRTASIMLLVLGVLQVADRIAKGSKGTIRKLYWMALSQSPLLIAAVVFLTFLVAVTPFLDTYDINLSGRILMLQRYFAFYRLTLFGQPIAYGSEFYRFGLSTLDNSYMRLLLNNGIIMFVLYIIAFIALIRKYVKNRDTKLLIVITLFAVYGLFETVAVRFEFNFSLILLNQIVQRKDVVYKPSPSVQNRYSYKGLEENYEASN